MNLGNDHSTPTTKRLSITLSLDAADLLEWLAKKQGITQTEALRKAIATEAYLYKEMQQGAKIMILTANEEIKEIVFR